MYYLVRQTSLMVKNNKHQAIFPSTVVFENVLKKGWSLLSTKIEKHIYHMLFIEIL